jgi:hypothetical protein
MIGSMQGGISSNGNLCHTDRRAHRPKVTTIRKLKDLANVLLKARPEPHLAGNDRN